MDKVFEKIGIYDIMGLWMPGVIITTYGVLTLEPIVKWLYETLKISSFGLDRNAIYILMFTVVAYTVGTVLHELGKILFDRWDSLNMQKVSYFDGIDQRPAWFKIRKQIQWEYNIHIASIKKGHISLRALLEDGIDGEKITVSMANNKLTYKYGRPEKIGKTHAIYGLNRSLLIGFVIHLLTMVCMAIFMHSRGLEFSWSLCVCLVLLDAALILVFFVRSYRYLLAYVRNVYIQYFFFEYDSKK